MRCIEMRYRNAFINTVNRLTLTWDVLKLFSHENIILWILRLTLTWDVLKWQNIIISGQCYID